jgi:hypothetical protein
MLTRCVILPAVRRGFDQSCRELLQRRMLAEPGAQLVLGHFYVAQDGEAAASVCGWSASSRYGAFGACSREAAKRGITAPACCW